MRIEKLRKEIEIKRIANSKVKKRIETRRRIAYRKVKNRIEIRRRIANRKVKKRIEICGRRNQMVI